MKGPLSGDPCPRTDGAVRTSAHPSPKRVRVLRGWAHALCQVGGHLPVPRRPASGRNPPGAPPTRSAGPAPCAPFWEMGRRLPSSTPRSSGARAFPGRQGPTCSGRVAFPGNTRNPPPCFRVTQSCTHFPRGLARGRDRQHGPSRGPSSLRALAAPPQPLQTPRGKQALPRPGPACLRPAASETP